MFCTRLFVTSYEEVDVRRKQELELCREINSSIFEFVHPVGETYALALQEMRRKTKSIEDSRTISVLANSDIIFTEAALRLIDRHLEPEQVYCLTRWDVRSRGGIDLWSVDYSQDSWCFRGQPREGIEANFRFGVPGCDNRFAYELQKAGYEILNPSQSIPTYHLHLSQVRRNNSPHNRVEPPYLFIAPHSLTGKAAPYIPAKKTFGVSSYQR